MTRPWRHGAFAAVAVAGLLAGIASAAPSGRVQPRSLRVPILMYHRIDRRNASLPSLTQRLTVTPRDFAAEMDWLARHGFQTITQRQLYTALEQRGRLPRRPVMITFDDGYRDVFEKASETLVRLRMRATAYVITGRISGADVSFLTWGQLKALEARGIEIGSHTVHHYSLTGLASGEAFRELVDSRRALERHLDHPVRWLAYPYGGVDPRIVRLARRAGYLLAVTTRAGDDQDGRAPLELRRYEILDSTGVVGLASLLG